MPANMPYPGESEEEFMIRMAAQQGGGMPQPQGMHQATDPRAMAIAQMMQMPAPGARPVEEMMGSGQHGMPGGPEEGFGGDASMADAYGGPDPYTSGLPGATGPRTPMQNRNRRVMLSEPGETDDEFEQREMLGDYETTGGTMDTMGPSDDEPSTEDELDMVQQNIGKAGDDSNDDFGGKQQGELTGELENDLGILESLADDDYDIETYLDDFVRLHGESNVPQRFRHFLENPDEE